MTAKHGGLTFVLSPRLCTSKYLQQAVSGPVRRPKSQNISPKRLPLIHLTLAGQQSRLATVQVCRWLKR